MITRSQIIRAFVRELRAAPFRIPELIRLLIIQLRARDAINQANSELKDTQQTKHSVAKQRGEFISGASPKLVSVVCATNRPQNVTHLIDNVLRQNYPELELVIILHGDGFDKQSIKQTLDKKSPTNMLLTADSATSFGDVLNKAISHATGFYVAKFDDDDDYGANHIWDLVNAYETHKAKLVGKWGHYVYLEKKDVVVDFGLEHANKYVHHLSGGTILGETKYLQSVQFNKVNRAIDSNICSKILSKGGLLYSTHPYNYVRRRNANHTYARSDESFINSSSKKPVAGYQLEDYEA